MLIGWWLLQKNCWPCFSRLYIKKHIVLLTSYSSETNLVQFFHFYYWFLVSYFIFGCAIFVRSITANKQLKKSLNVINKLIVQKLLNVFAWNFVKRFYTTRDFFLYSKKVHYASCSSMVYQQLKKKQSF